MPAFWRSLSFRLALAYAALLCLSMGLLAAAYFWIAVERPLDRIKAQVSREQQVLAQLYIVDGEAALIAALQRRAGETGPDRAFHAFLSPQGRLVSGNLPSWPARPVRGWFSIEADVYQYGDEKDFSALSRDRVFRNGARLIVGRDAEAIEDREEVVVMALPWLLGLTILFGIAGGLFMSLAIGRRLESISAAARQVMAGDLAGRVATAGSGDDFDRLGDTINAMLDRNQELIEAIRRVSDNVAHELRTPLARLIARLETLGSNLDDPDATMRDADAALAEAQRLQAISNALLRISRIEGGRHDGNWREVNLAVLVADAVELYGPAAAEKGIDLAQDCASDVPVRADADLLFQALANLLDNALKHTPAGGTVRVCLDRQGGEAVLAVVDTGPGLRDGEADRITERFFRGEAAQGLPGEGLGLSLVAAIAQLHGAQLRFIQGEPGLRAELALPAGGKTGAGEASLSR